MGSYANGVGRIQPDSNRILTGFYVLDPNATKSRPTWPPKEKLEPLHARTAAEPNHAYSGAVGEPLPNHEVRGLRTPRPATEPRDGPTRNFHKKYRKKYPPGRNAGLP